MSEKKPFHIALVPTLQRKLKILAAEKGVVPGDIVTALVDSLDVIEEMDGDPIFRKRFLAIFDSCVRDVGVEAKFEGEEIAEAMQKGRLWRARESIKNLKKRREGKE